MSLSITDIISRLEHFGQVIQTDKLTEALHELDSIIEMKEAKDAICLQLEYIIMKMTNKSEATPNIFDDHMLHTVISGPPGVGKTRLGKVLAKIWYSLGILKGKRPHPEIPEKVYRKFISQYERSVNNTNHNLEKIIASLDDSIRKARNNCLRPIIRSLEDIQQNLRSTQIQNVIPSITPSIKDDPPFRIATRADFVGRYVGHTAPKTLALLEECVGGVLFIDEAYILINGTHDSFGMEALTELNRFMSERPNDLIVIFAGYKDLLEDTIFKAQPGLKRRCSWVFDIESYTPSGLAAIFKFQLAEYGWSVDEKVNLVEFFTKNKEEFPNFGGDTHRLTFYCKLYYMHFSFHEVSEKVGKKRKRSPPELSYVINERTLLTALEKLKQNKTPTTSNDVPMGMYI